MRLVAEAGEIEGEFGDEDSRYICIFYYFRLFYILRLVSTYRRMLLFSRLLCPCAHPRPFTGTVFLFTVLF